MENSSMATLLNEYNVREVAKYKSPAFPTEMTDVAQQTANKHQGTLEKHQCPLKENTAYYDNY